MKFKGRVYTGNYKNCELLIVTNSFKGGGAENFILEYCEYLDSNKITFVCVVINPLTAYEKRSLPRNGFVIELNKNRLRYALIDLVHLILVLKPRRIFSSILPLNCFFGLLAHFFLRKSKVLVRNPIVLSHHFEKTFSGHLRLKLYLFSLRKVERIFCQSNDMLMDLRLLAPHLSRKTLTLPNPFRYRLWRKLKENNFKSPNRYKKLEPFEFCWIGRLEKQKSLETALIALSYITDLKWNLGVAGTGSQEKQLAQRVKDLGIEKHVKFFGFLDDPWIELSSSDALILSSRYEGNPNVVLEAISWHMSVISLPASGGINELKERFSEVIILSQDTSPLGLAKAIRSWVISPRGTAEKQALEKLSPDIVFKDYTKHIFAPD